MQKVLLVTVLECSQELLHDTRNMQLLEFYLLVFHQPHQIMLHVLKDEIESTAILAKVHCLLLVSDDLAQLYDILVVELAKDFYLANRCDWETFLLVLETNFFERHDLLCVEVAGFVHLSVGP